MEPKTLLIESFRAAVAAADPLHIVPRHLPPPPRGRTLVVGAGKAAASMAKAVEDHWPAEAPLSGLVITRYQHGLPTRRIRVVEAGHPVPDESGEAAAREILQEVKRVGPDDLVLALVSGGGSSLLSLPAPGIDMADLKAVTRELLACGASIQEINTVRKHLSLIQGGRLAAACQAPVLALIVSDVTGDDPTHIASGPFAPDPTTYEDALAVLREYRIEPPPAVRAHLERGCKGSLPETPKPGDPIFDRVENRIIATAHGSLVAAGEYFRRRQIPTAILGDSVTGEAREVARVYAALVREVRAYGHPWKPPVALVCGGETTVTVQGKGRGGRNCEFLLALTLALEALPKVHAIACDTDGIDGTEDNAGAVCGPDTLTRARTLSLDARARLANNDGYTFFERLGDLVITGPTRTNVNDYRAMLIL